jgi:hypothetical protein
MKIIGLAIIVCLTIIEICFYYHNQNEQFKNKLEEEKKEKKTAEEKKKQIHNNIKPIQNSLLNKIELVKEEQNDDILPWYKIRKLENGFNEYILKVNNVNEKKLLEWKELTRNLKYDKINKKISYTTQQEGEALAVVNLVLSNLNNDIDIKEILDNNLLSISIKKAINHKLVSTKLKELINIANNKEPSDEFDFDIDTYNIDIELSKDEPFQPYIGKEYSLL